VTCSTSNSLALALRLRLDRITANKADGEDTRMKTIILAGALVLVVTGAMAQNSLYGGFGTGVEPE
jgi:hypothetical protein